ncbi:hypothetical protein [Pedobacter sp.]
MKFSLRRNREKWPVVKDAAANLLAILLHRAKTRIVGLLQHWEKRCTWRQKRILLIVFCALFSGYCIYLLIGALSGSSDGIANLKLREQNGVPPPELPPPRFKGDSLKGGW